MDVVYHAIIFREIYPISLIPALAKTFSSKTAARTRDFFVCCSLQSQIFFEES